MLYEIIGYIATGFVLASFLMTSVVRLRIINMIGGLISTIYSLLIHAYPTVVMNVALIIINSYQLFKYFTSKNEYSVLTLNSEDSYYKFFLEHYKEDIKKFFPMFESHTNENYIKAVLHDEKIVGILIGKKENNELTIWLDYAIPAYRDCSVGKYLYSYLPIDQIKIITLADHVENNESYLNKIGFDLVNGKYQKKL